MSTIDLTSASGKGTIAVRATAEPGRISTTFVQPGATSGSSGERSEWWSDGCASARPHGEKKIIRTTLMRMLAAVLFTLWLAQSVFAQPTSAPYVRLAEWQVGAAHLAEFRALAGEFAATAARAEPGLLALHVTVEKERPDHLRVFALYADEAAYQAHLQTPHFKMFVADTQSMLGERKRFESVPVRLGAKATMPADPVVRVAELEISPAALAAYVNAVTEEIDESIRVEPGVIAIYAVALKDAPNQLRFLEIYADEAAYRRHIASPHFRKYVAITKDMISARRLLETTPVSLYLRAP